MPGRNIVVIGGSTGGLEALREIVARLPAGLPAAVFVTLHTAPDNPGVLDKILSRAGVLTAGYARDRETIRDGHIFIAPPDRHLLLKRHHVRITNGPRENRFRPAVDPMFRTAAIAHRQRVIGIVLSGGQDDGAVGLAMIKRQCAARGRGAPSADSRRIEPARSGGDHGSQWCEQEIASENPKI